MMKKGIYFSALGRGIYIFIVAFPGHPEYGCFISPDKTLTNFDHDDQLLNVVDPSQQSNSFSLNLVSERVYETSIQHFHGADMRST
jgi:hypothetical protein